MKFYTRKRRLPAVIIVPMIDILAILLIFVIVTTTFRRDQPEIVIRLPESKSGSAESVADNPILLSISDKGEFAFDNRSVTSDQLKDEVVQLLKTDRPRPLALNADTKAPFGSVLKVMDILKDAGVKNLPTFTENPGTDASK